MPSNPRHTAATILTDWDRSGGKIDEIRDRHLHNTTLEERDRALVTEIVYGVTRNKAVLDRELSALVKPPLDKLQRGLLPVLEVGLYQLRFLDRVPPHAAVHEAVEDARHIAGDNAAGLVNAVLRNAQRKPGERQVDAFTTHGTPLFRWRNHWIEQWDEDTADELISFYKQIPPVGLRRNRLRTESDEAWHAILREEGVDFEVLEDWPGTVYARDVRPAELPSFEQGLTTVQDPAPSLAVTALDPQPGERILDLCAAPGGKTALIWEMMGGQGELIAVDKSMKRNKLTRETLHRLGHDAVQVHTEDLLSFHSDPFDRVLIDVPCSGTGVAHRRADLLVRRSPLKVEQLGKIQRQLLNHAATLVKPGGVLVYSTCSLEWLENGKRIAGFDKRNKPDFQHDELPEAIKPPVRQEKVGTASTWPPRDRVDGAFITRWRRQA